MKKKILLSTLLFAFSSAVMAAPLINQWRGSGADADKWFCEYGDGQIIVIYANRNCPFSN